MKNNKLKKAFTMAEVLLVMVVMGVVGAIALSTLKPQDMKQEIMVALANKMLAEIDEATEQIIVNNTPNGYLTKIYVPNSTTNTFKFSSNCGYVEKYYRKYLTPTTKKVANAQKNNWYGIPYSNYFYLKNGGIIAFSCASTGNYVTIFPEEERHTSVSNDFYGRIMFDINAEEPPNDLGKDVFCIPIGKKGILYK